MADVRLIVRSTGRRPAMSIVTQVCAVTPTGPAPPAPRPVQLVAVVDGRATITLVFSPPRS